MFRRNWRTILIFGTIAGDAVSIALAGCIAFQLRRLLPNVPNLPDHLFFEVTLFFGGTILAIGAIMGLYRTTFHSNVRHQNFLASKTYVLSLLIVFSVFYVIQYVDFPRRFTLLFFLLLPFIYTIVRSLINGLNEVMRRRGFGLHNVILVGYENGGERVFERFKWFPELGYKVVGVVAKTKELQTSEVRVDGEVVPLFRIEHLTKVIEEFGINRIFLPRADVLASSYPEIMPIGKQKGVKIKVLSQEADHLLQLARVYDIAGITLYAPPREQTTLIRAFFKRLFDIVGSSLLLLALSPVFLLTGLAILIESGTPVFYKQRRASIKDGPAFNFYKFRSMIHNADELKEGLLRYNESSGAPFKMRNDPRMTKVGRFIRKYSIDELPQLLNVLLGDMSLVGPRPLPMGDFTKVDEGSEYWSLVNDRAKVKPGMTGLWQVSGRSQVGFKEMVLLDLYYVENQSLLFDLEILFATVPVVLFGRGAY